MDRPLVSILMTAYNRENYIGEAIESVLASNYNNFELIISDDCSSDRTLEIARNYQMKDERIKVYSNKKNLGDYPNRNEVAKYATGEFILYVDSDDKIFKDGISNCVDTMLKFPSAKFGMRWFNDDRETFLLPKSKTINNHFFDVPFLTIGPGGTIINRQFFFKIGMYPIKYGPANDMYFNLKAAIETDMVLISFEFMFYRRHAGQQINNNRGYLINNYLYLNDALKELPLNLSEQQINWLNKKNKRRFTINILKYLIKTRKITDVQIILKNVNYRFRDLIDAIFQ